MTQVFRRRSEAAASHSRTYCLCHANCSPRSRVYHLGVTDRRHQVSYLIQWLECSRSSSTRTPVTKLDGSRKNHPFALGLGLFRLQQGETLGMPLARPMPTVAPGVSELRVKGEDGIFRVFYFTATAKGILVFHAFVKKTQRTPPLEIELAKKRLKELLDA